MLQTALDRHPLTVSNLTHRVAVVEDHSEMAGVLHDLLADDAIVTVASGIGSLTSLAESRPHMIVVGLGPHGDLESWDLVALIRKHRLLREVPVIVCTLDVAADMRAGRLTAHANVHAAEMPCDGEVIREIGGAPGTNGWSTTRRAGHLPDVCPHGFMTDADCRVCWPHNAWHIPRRVTERA